MHISDGILSSEVIISTTVIAVGFVLYSLTTLKNKNIAIVSAMGAIFFIASFIHIRIMLTGWVGAIL